MKKTALLLIISSILIASTSFGAISFFKLEGLEGNGLLPGNGQPAAGTADAGDSSATGGEINGTSLSYDSDTGIFSFDFQFQDLTTGGLFTAAVFGGIHIHGPTTLDQFGSAGVLYRLNTTVENQPGLVLTSGTLANGVQAGRLTGSVVIDSGDVTALLDGFTYINIHSDDFQNGELRGNLIVVPEPAYFAPLFGLAAFFFAFRFKNRK